MAETMILDERCSFLSVAVPYTGKQQGDGKVPQPQYRTHILLRKGSPQLAKVEALERKQVMDAWGKENPVHGTQMYNKLKAEGKLALRDGDILYPNDEAYAGMMFLAANLKATSKSGQPQSVPVFAGIPKNADGSANYVKPGDAAYPQSGDFCNFMVDIYAQTKGDGAPRVNTQFQGIQLARKGTPLGGGVARVAKGDEFGVVASALDADAPGSAVDGLI